MSDEVILVIDIEDEQPLAKSALVRNLGRIPFATLRKADGDHVDGLNDGHVVSAGDTRMDVRANGTTDWTAGAQPYPLKPGELEASAGSVAVTPTKNASDPKPAELATTHAISECPECNNTNTSTHMNTEAGLWLFNCAKCGADYGAKLADSTPRAPEAAADSGMAHKPGTPLDASDRYGAAERQPSK